MEKIMFYLLLESDDFKVYEVRKLVAKQTIGKIYLYNKNGIVHVKYNFDEKEFSEMIGAILLNDFLVFSLEKAFKSASYAEINMKEPSVFIDCYNDCFDVEKKEDKNGVCYYLKK